MKNKLIMNTLTDWFRKSLFLSLHIIICFSMAGQDVITKPEKISFIFAGDIMGHDDQILSAENRETHTYNYDDVFKYISPVISEADIAFANLEVTLAGKPYKGYPQFSSPAELASACSKAGFDYLVTANNHSADRGMQGIKSTISKLDSMGIPHTGTFINRASRDTLSPLMIYRNGFSIALLNYTHSTNGLNVPDPAIVNMLDKDDITRDIETAHNNNADIVILFLHWGTEYDTVPSSLQSDMASDLLKAGADLVIGSHPHVLQKMIRVKDQAPGKDGIIIYSLGNCVSNQRKPKTDGGSMVRVEYTRQEGSFRISDAGYYLTWVYTPTENYKKKYYILPCSGFEKDTTFFAIPADYLQMKRFIKDSRALLNNQNIGIGEYIFNGTSWLLNN